MKPIYPKQNTQNWEILGYLHEAGQLTPLGALFLCGCFRLSERIRELEALGWKIKHDRVKLKNGKHVMSYSLE